MLILGFVAVVVTWNPNITSFVWNMDWASTSLYVLIAMFIFMSIGAIGLLIIPDDAAKNKAKTSQNEKTKGSTN